MWHENSRAAGATVKLKMMTTNTPDSQIIHPFSSHNLHYHYSAMAWQMQLSTRD